MNTNNKSELAYYLKNLDRAEVKKINDLTKGENKISLLVHSSSLSHATLFGVNRKPYIVVVAIITENSRAYYGNFGNGSFQLGNHLSDENFVRVIIDSRNTLNKKMDVHYNNTTSSYSTKEEADNNLIFMYVETKDYAHYCLYDGLIIGKFSEIYVRESSAKESLRTITTSTIRRMFPELSNEHFYGE